MVDPVFLAPCGHHFDRPSLPPATTPSPGARHPFQCPICGEEVVSVAPARALKELIDSWGRPSSPVQNSSPALTALQRPNTTPSTSRGDLDAPSQCARPHSCGDFKLPVHLTPCDRRRSQQCNSASGSPAGRPSQMSPDRAISSPHGGGLNGSRSSIGHLESFTF
eukprot:EG_transcript_33803